MYVFAVLVNQILPDLIFGCESWLSPAVHNTEVFPPNFVIYRRDRMVMVAHS